MNPRLRAPLPPAAVALARRPPARDSQSPGLGHGGECLRCHHSPKLAIKSKGKTNRKQKTSTSVSRQSRLYCGDTAAVRTLRRQDTSPRRAPPFTPAPVTVRRGRAESSPAPEAEGVAPTPHSSQRLRPQAAVLSLLHRGWLGPRDAERRKATAARS